MCGIAGILKKDGTSPDRALLQGMADRIAHRGPDAEGAWIAPGIGLAHRRLAIIDLSPRGMQPMHDAAQELTIVFNGEIYNYRELRQLLSADWKSDSDTEVILEGYRQWGDGVIEKLRGMFAFALWDQRERRLLVARDRIGKKPFFYTLTSVGDLTFASEVKALQPFVHAPVDWEAVRLFLGLQYVPSPRTGFMGIQQLPPGSKGVWQDGTWKVEKYHEWLVPQIGQMRSGIGAEQIDQDIRTKLDEAVKIRQLTADVPVGAFLSGGVDSAAVVAYASQYASKPLHTFTMGFMSKKMDERSEAEEIARYFGTEHHAFEAKPEQLLELVDTLVGAYDVPYADSSALPLWLLSRETAQHIKVVLTGDGGDEAFGGYRRYVAYEQAIHLSKSFFGGAIPPLATAASRVFHDPRFARMAETLQAMKNGPERGYGELFCGSYFGSRDLQELCTKEFLEQTKNADAVDFVTNHIRRGACHAPSDRTTERLDGMSVDMSEGVRHTPLQDAILFDLTSYLSDDLNVKMDRATMAFGLEARAPFLDQELIAYALTLPLNQRVLHGQTKIALKRALHGIVPEAVLRRPKRGFQVPLAEWFRGPLHAMVRERCLSSASPLRSIFHPHVMSRLIEGNNRGLDHGNRLWMLCALSSWLSTHSS